MLLLGGYGWSASSPLAYTLSRNSKYCHFGYTKDMRYLEWKNCRLVYNKRPIRQLQNIYNLVKNNRYTNWQSSLGHKMNLPMDMEVLQDFPLIHLERLLTGHTTSTKLINFYKELYYHTSERGYKSVGDAFTGTFVRSPNRLQRTYFDNLTREFDTKFVCIFRDPVRRAFGESLRHYQEYLRRRNTKDNNITELSLPDYRDTYTPLRKSVLPGTLYQEFLDQSNWGSAFRKIDYVGNLIKAQKIFGKDRVHCVIMEELWEGSGSGALSQFLDHPIDNLWPNAYAPDAGHLIEYFSDSPCQSDGMNLQELTPSLYRNIKAIFQSVYDDWEQYFGSLPLFWGEPLKYPEGRPLGTTE